MLGSGGAPTPIMNRIVQAALPGLGSATGDSSTGGISTGLGAGAASIPRRQAGSPSLLNSTISAPVLPESKSTGSKSLLGQ